MSVDTISAPSPVPVGERAPNLRLRSTPDQFLSMQDFRGRPVVLIFYPADWSPVCTDQLVLYQEVMQEFRRNEAQLLGISVDGAWCHAAFAKDRKLRFPLLADFEPKGAWKTYRRRMFRPAANASDSRLITLPKGICL